MNASELFRVGDDRLLCHPWHAGAHTVVLRPASDSHPLHANAITAVVKELTNLGVARVLTPALDEHTAEVFVAAGFAQHEQLCVLRHDLTQVPSVAEPRTKRARIGRDIPRAAVVDGCAFGSSDQLDEAGLRAAISATSATRFRIVTPPGRAKSVVGYVVCGMACDRGYVQRLAVVPEWRRRGCAAALVNDGLRWFRRHGATGALVNTQVDNEAARRLYAALGFVETADRLEVLTLACDPA